MHGVRCTRNSFPWLVAYCNPRVMYCKLGRALLPCQLLACVMKSTHLCGMGWSVRPGECVCVCVCMSCVCVHVMLS